MNKKTRPPRRPPPPASAPQREDPGTLIERTIGGLWQAVAAGDPLRAELETATWMALPRVGRRTPTTPRPSSKLLVDGAVGVRTPEAAALLRVVVSLGTPLTKRAASRGLARLTAAGIYPPEWVTEVGKPVPVRAWRRYDVFGDDEVIAVTFRYGEAEHGIVGQVDLTGMPIVMGVGVTLIRPP